jgi:hypothetical protein
MKNTALQHSPRGRRREGASVLTRRVMIENNKGGERDNTHTAEKARREGGQHNSGTHTRRNETRRDETREGLTIQLGRQRRSGGRGGQHRRNADGHAAGAHTGTACGDAANTDTDTTGPGAERAAVQ